MKRACLIGLVVLAIQANVPASDWNQWRGSDRNGVAAQSPALSDTWGTNGPRRLWVSDPIPAAENGGFSCVTVANGREYVFVNWKTYVPMTTRKLTESGLRELGWFPDKLPDELAQAMEAARVSEERAKLSGQDLSGWVQNWVTAHVPTNGGPALTPLVAGRLNRGRAAIALADLGKLATIKDKEFANPGELDAWLAASGLATDVCAAVVRSVPTNQPVSRDVIVCLDGQGKIAWKKEYPGRATGYGSSSTPCVMNGRCYAAGDKTLYCLDAVSGNQLWTNALTYGEVSSSPAVIDGVVVILGGALYGVDAASGQQLWMHKELEGNAASATPWQKDGKGYALCNTLQGVVCVEPRTGQVLWKVPGGGNGTATVAGDSMVLLADKPEVGLVAYKLRAAGADKLWSQAIADRGTTPVVYGGYVYVVGANRIGCWALADGALKWEHKQGCEISSPIVADGKLIALIGGVPHMMRASPEAYALLGRAPTIKAALVSSPAFADGRLYLRLPDAVACYDLTKTP
jgi:outer membrane protein assembly factor BamB